MVIAVSEQARGLSVLCKCVRGNTSWKAGLNCVSTVGRAMIQIWIPCSPIFGRSLKDQVDTMSRLIKQLHISDSNDEACSSASDTASSVTEVRILRQILFQSLSSCVFCAPNWIRTRFPHVECERW